jgi:hypothetical protein
MSLLTIAQAIQAKISTDFTAAAGRVYLLSSKEAYTWMQSYATPGVGIVFSGGSTQPTKDTSLFQTYNFDIHIYQSIWMNDGEKGVMAGEGSQKGLLEMQETLWKIVDAYLETADVFDARITTLFGSTDYPEIGGDGIGATIGFTLQVREAT